VIRLYIFELSFTKTKEQRRERAKWKQTLEFKFNSKNALNRRSTEGSMHRLVLKLKQTLGQ
jgi:hypothetical protein